VRLRAESFSPTQNVTAPEKTFRIRVNSSTSLLGIGLLLASLVAIVVGAVVFWIRLNRR
jgi:hypothetical protein